MDEEFAISVYSSKSGNFLINVVPERHYIPENVKNVPKKGIRHTEKHHGEK